jgi:hypothetical protein
MKFWKKGLYIGKKPMVMVWDLEIQFQVIFLLKDFLLWLKPPARYVKEN